MDSTLPVAIIGGGPIGLAAAAHLVSRGVPVRLFEAREQIASNLRDWGHVRLFSIWDQCTDPVAVALLERHGWKRPRGESLPTGRDLVEAYLEPLAAVSEMNRVIETDAAVTRVTRQGLDRMASKNRAAQPFAITVRNRSGDEREVLARAVIDTSGTWQNPNPIGVGGWALPGETDASASIAYGIPDVSGVARHDYAGKHTLVFGGGHSAANALLDLALLAVDEPETTMTWAVRGTSLAKVFGGGSADQLPARGRLGDRLRALTDTGRLTMVLGFAAHRLTMANEGIVIKGLRQGSDHAIGHVDRIIVATGQRPDFCFASELQLDLHPIVESTRALGPLIDPNEHSCGSVPPHGWRELAHTEPGFFVAGIKSYGRAPTFLLLTGYEQVRSITAYLAGDLAAADDVRLMLPETGICNATLEDVAPGALCCDGAAPNAADPCCERPAAEKGTTCCAPAANQVTEPTAKAASCCGPSVTKKTDELAMA